MIKSPPTDTPPRKSSRLSNFYSLKGKPSKGDNVHLNQYAQLTPPHKPSLDGASISSSDTNTIHRTNSNTDSNNYTYGYGAGHHEQLTNENYRLIRMSTNKSADSDYSLQSQYKVALNLNKKEIEMIRYTWNVMLIDKVIVQQKSRLPIPGGFPLSNVKEKTQVNKLNASSIASSLFCRQLYGNLILKDKDLEKMFPSIKHQAVSFAGVMTFAISQLENLSVLDEYLMKLGKRHSRILNIEPAQFELMGEALIETFHERFGRLFDQELEILWIKLYLYISNSILQFGLDPILRLQDDPMNSDYSIEEVTNSSRSVTSYESTGRRISASTGITSQAPSDFAHQMATPQKTNDSYLKNRTPHLFSKIQSGGLPPLPPQTPSANGSKSVGKLLKKKKDCVIM